MTSASMDIISDAGADQSLLAATRTVRRRAFYFESLGQPLFAWLHLPDGRIHHNHAVVICPPIGFEQLHGHRGLRHLADRLAAQGIPTLRFDWHGTGDSSGEDADPDRVSSWLANVRSAVQWTRDELQCSRVSVVGLRLGATLAAMALEHESIDNLVLWAPVTGGRSFVRELNAVDMMSDALATEREPGVIEAAGFQLTPATAAELSRVSLLRANPACRRILVVGRDDSPTDRRIADHFEAMGITVDQHTQPGVAQMLVEPHKSQVPDLAIAAVATWLNQQIEATSHVHDDVSSALPESCERQMEFVSQSRLIREFVQRISQSPNLFGILSEPDQPPPVDRPTIVLLNAGAAYRIGPGRMNVEMARQLASHGFRCLRLDLCGLGDSVTTEAASENDSYPSTAFRDIRLALDYLRRQKGSRRFVLMGLCSGAYAAFQSAAQFTDSDLVECILINPLTYYWRDGMSLETAPTLELIREHYYLNSAFQPAKWLRLLSGRSQIGIHGALRLVAQRLGVTDRRSRARSSESGAREPSHPATEDLTGDLKSVLGFNRQLTMFFSTSDPGHNILMYQAGRQARKMLRRGQMTARFIDGADHTFSRQTARKKLFSAVLEHLRQRFQSVD